MFLVFLGHLTGKHHKRGEHEEDPEDAGGHDVAKAELLQLLCIQRHRMEVHSVIVDEARLKV